MPCSRYSAIGPSVCPSRGPSPQPERSVPQALELAGVALPFLEQLDPQVEVHARAEDRLQVRPGPRTDVAQHLTALADDDALLGVPLDIEGGVDRGDALGL